MIYFFYTRDDAESWAKIGVTAQKPDQALDALRDALSEARGISDAAIDYTYPMGSTRNHYIYDLTDSHKDGVTLMTVEEEELPTPMIFDWYHAAQKVPLVEIAEPVDPDEAGKQALATLLRLLREQGEEWFDDILTSAHDFGILDFEQAKRMALLLNCSCPSWKEDGDD